jgi:hypothetical protein
MVNCVATVKLNGVAAIKPDGSVLGCSSFSYSYYKRNMRQKNKNKRRRVA